MVSPSCGIVEVVVGHIKWELMAQKSTFPLPPGQKGVTIGTGWGCVNLPPRRRGKGWG